MTVNKGMNMFFFLKLLTQFCQTNH